MNSLPDLLARLDRRASVLERRSLTLSRARLAVAIVGFFGGMLVGKTVGSGAGWSAALVALLLFSVLVRLHDRIEQARTKLALWREIKARHVARVALDWAALPPAPEPPPAGHAYASDLDLAGPRSLLHLIDATGTLGASQRLRSWLLHLDMEAAPLRQSRVQALVPRLRFRDRLALLAFSASGSADERWDDRPVRAWLDAPPIDRSLVFWAVGLSGLAALTAGLAVLALAGGPSVWTYSLVAYILIYLARYRSVFQKSYDLEKTLRQLAPMLALVEREAPRLLRSPEAEPLRAVVAPFTGESSPGGRMRRIRRIASAAALSRNDVGRIVLNLILPYDLLVSLALDRLRADLADLLPAWLDALYELEALGALAAAHDLRPEHTTFPDLLASSASPDLFTAADLRHPLIGLADSVGNDVALDRGEVIVVTGSNMSGKSTFLRAIGVAGVLAWAGGPVWARSLSASPMRPFTSMRIGDVLQEGLSTFYAEVRRLRLLLDGVEAGGPPALVLIDEMLRGTNNRERLAGAQGYVRALIGARATTLVATHDLALGALEEEDARVSNAHFRERADGDRLAFDYRLRDGICPTTNALVIMERAGLPVGTPEPT